ncbi:MerR family transcriptional regulator [Clostridium rectalis]|uniref:MerR family transcriptional regulator n=1 Tax=Clostridium rectalis TaxID=2040295 RepID=UPI000F6411BC|nr:MerR family transcriptional regulator [Clostridium rectalis]
MYYKIKEVADMAGISVRMLHHYHKIGLLKPDYIKSNGYRLYTYRNLEKLQQILFYKELDFSLQEIKNLLDNPGFNSKNALKAHKRLLIEKKERMERIIKSLDKTLKSLDEGVKMNSNDLFKPFDMTQIEKHKREYAKETKEKYGSSKEYKQSKEKTAKYTKDNWINIMNEAEKICEKVALLMDREPHNHEVQEAVGAWRKFITDNFYECSIDNFRGLGELYIVDKRFTKNIDKYKKGLAKFLSEAINIYCNNLKY